MMENWMVVLVIACIVVNTVTGILVWLIVSTHRRRTEEIALAFASSISDMVDDVRRIRACTENRNEHDGIDTRDQRPF